MTRAEVLVRPVRPGDLAALLGLIAEHAAFEGGQAPAEAAALSQAFFAPPPRLFGWVAVADAGPLGYASATREFSTWRGREHLHMDCLFVSTAARNRGVGARLAQAVLGFAAAQGLSEVQWQTPAWNADAARLYERLGAVGTGKIRFSLSVARSP